MTNVSRQLTFVIRLQHIQRKVLNQVKQQTKTINSHACSS